MKELICIVCPKGCHLKVDEDNDYAVTGNECIRGIKYGKEECTAPQRVVTSTVKIKGGIYPRISVKTDANIPKELVFTIVDKLNDVELTAPVKLGDIVIKDICNTGVNIVATRNMDVV